MRIFREREIMRYRDLSPQYSKILQISKNAAQVWFQKGEHKLERYKEAACELLQYLDIHTVADPNFARALTPEEHIRVVELLAEFIPKDTGHQKQFELDSHPQYLLIARYLQTIIPLFVDNKDKADELFTKLGQIGNLPKRYIEEAIPLKVTSVTEI